MMSDNSPLAPSYLAYGFTNDDGEPPVFQYTVEDEAETQDWPSMEGLPVPVAPLIMPADEDALVDAMTAMSPSSPYLSPDQQKLTPKQYTGEEWEAMRPIIFNLYIKHKRPLEAVMRVMERDHAFKAT